MLSRAVASAARVAPAAPHTGSRGFRERCAEHEASVPNRLPPLLPPGAGGAESSIFAAANSYRRTAPFTPAHNIAPMSWETSPPPPSSSWPEPEFPRNSRLRMRSFRLFGAPMAEEPFRAEPVESAAAAAGPLRRIPRSNRLLSPKCPSVFTPAASVCPVVGGVSAGCCGTYGRWQRADPGIPTGV